MTDIGGDRWARQDFRVERDVVRQQAHPESPDDPAGGDDHHGYAPGDVDVVVDAARREELAAHEAHVHVAAVEVVE